MIIVISHPHFFKNEIQIINNLFEEGLDCFQLLKPEHSAVEIQTFIEQISPIHRSKVVEHSNFLKFHSINELEACKESFDYAFLSPIFDSISKKGYKSSFDLLELKGFFQNYNKKIIALGGIQDSNIELLNEIHFAGIAMLGAIWQSDSPIDVFKKSKEKWNKKHLAF